METLTRIVAAIRSACAPYTSRISRDWFIAFALALTLVVGYYALFAPPRDFPAEYTFRIVEGASVSEIAENLADARIIAHQTLFRTLLRVSGESGNVQTGVYLFNKPENLFSVAYRLVTGAYGLPPVRITFIEGVTAREAGEQVATILTDISAQNFEAKAKPYEGYLFPDTYFFQRGADADLVIETMRKNFNTKVASLADEIRVSGHTLQDIVIMASLVEKEARTPEVRRMVSGILWNRLELGMPLQVDAVFGYIFNRDTYSPSYADLKVDSPYNTYTHRGLPPTPICNPGLDALEAVLDPAHTKYLFYLTDRNGVMHYATTYAEHQENKRKYLR